MGRSGDGKRNNLLGWPKMNKPLNLNIQVNSELQVMMNDANYNLTESQKKIGGLNF